MRILVCVCVRVCVCVCVCVYVCVCVCMHVCVNCMIMSQGTAEEQLMLFSLYK